MPDRRFTAGMENLVDRITLLQRQAGAHPPGRTLQKWIACAGRKANTAFRFFGAQLRDLGWLVLLPRLGVGSSTIRL